MLSCIYILQRTQFHHRDIGALSDKTRNPDVPIAENTIYSYLMEVGAIVQNIWPGVMEMIKLTNAQGQRPSAIVHLIISIIEGQIFFIIATTSIK